MDRLDIWRAVKLLIDRYGHEAGLVAGIRADERPSGATLREKGSGGNGPPLSGLVEIDLKYLGGAPKRRKDGQKSKRGKGTAKPRILIAVQRDDRMRATVVPSEKAEDIHAALDGVVAQPVQIFSDKDHTFVNVIKALGAGHQTVVHSAKEFVRGEVHSNTADGIGSLLSAPEWASGTG
jgi:hypothetical protein